MARGTCRAERPPSSARPIFEPARGVSRNIAKERYVDRCSYWTTKPTKPSSVSRSDEQRDRSAATRFDMRAKRMQQGTSDMLIARQGEEIVCPKGTVCGRITRDANDQIIDGDFAAREFSSSPADQRYVCACCGRPVAVREPVRWRVHLRRGWVR
jgi:hypothetical protein